MNYLMILSVTTGTVCFGWAAIAPVIGMLTWAGFAGCTTFFAAGGREAGVKSALATNINGLVIATIMIYLTGLINIPIAGAIITGIGVFIMCIQSKIKIFSYIPGTFVGAFSTFAGNGETLLVLISMILGVGVGYACEKSALVISTKKDIPIEL